MQNICLVLSYIGTNYSGFQVQNNATSVQQVLENAIFQSIGEHCKLIPSGRTDAGVHALGQVANFLSNTTIPAEKMYIVLNQILPKDIRVLDSFSVPSDFNARKNSKKKTYLYRMFLGKTLCALDEGRVLHVPQRIDLEKMQTCCKLLVGEHDFSGYVSSGAGTFTTTRQIFDCSLTQNGEYLDFEICGNGFLYNMVRILVGTILEVGKGKRTVKNFASTLNGASRTSTGQTAPAYALYLKKVEYK